ncbi:family 43 glycosylhydrolase [Pedobacter sp. P351]|uniref:family 43 glycosylhydrolase n=1 Tax=Pedobacter superstes TaxID=3133441 RepID=UPI00309E8DD8
MRTKYIFYSSTIFIYTLLFFVSTSAQTGGKTDNVPAGFYQNPVLGGDYPDPSILRDGKNYYMTHSSFEYYPGLLVWHSTDLLNWKRIGFALNKNVGSVWAPDLIKHKDTYYIYFPAGGTNWVVTAKSPEGPWSAPVDLKLSGYIDPGHLVDGTGTRYLYLSKGFIVKLAEDGLSTAGEPQSGYKGWQYPKEWSTECFCLESPKSTIKDGYFHQIVAEGGTAGPATSHMVVSGRSKSPLGPWENSPYNPIIHTASRAERWWSQGHGTLVDDVNGKWWILYHGYEKYYQTLGRQTLMLPVVWTKDNWFRVPQGISSSAPIRKPALPASASGSGLSDDFSGGTLGLQWQSFRSTPADRVVLKEGKLELQAKGNAFENSAPLLVNPADRRYEAQVEFTIEGNATAGMTLFYNDQGNMRVTADSRQFAVFNQKSRKISEPNAAGNHGYLKIINDENEISFYFSNDAKVWNRVERSIDATGFNHNIFGGFMSLRVGLFAFGDGKVVYDNFIYRKL